jgi:hypothetical protein
MVKLEKQFNPPHWDKVVKVLKGLLLFLLGEGSSLPVGSMILILPFSVCKFALAQMWMLDQREINAKTMRSN